MKRSACYAFTVLLLTTACALATNTPSTPQKVDARVKAVKLVDALTIGVKQINTASLVVSSLPIAQEIKNDINCTILKAIGVDAPSATVTQVCGVLPGVAASPLSKAVKDLHDLTTDAQLATTILVVLKHASSIWDKMSASANAALAAVGQILKAAFEPFLS